MINKNNKTKITAYFIAAILIFSCFNNSDISSVTAAGNKVKWSDVKVIRHACGEIDGNFYTNSREALNNSISLGVNAIEMDFMFTTSYKLVCLHKWSDIGAKKVLSTKAFKKRKIYGRYTTMSARKALKKLIKAGNIYLIVDTKDRNVTKIYKALIKILDDLPGGKAYKKMIVPQIYSEKQFNDLREVFTFRHCIYTLYKQGLKKDKDFKAAATFCVEKGIDTVTIARKKLTPERIAYFKQAGIMVATHTVNSAKAQSKYYSMGVDAIYSDTLY